MATTDKGEQILYSLLLDQYQNSPLLIEYMMAYISEMDYLYETIEEVYFGRFLDTAIGEQLDIIGEILQQTRNIDIATINFGFVGAPLALGFGTITDNTVGGVFRSLGSGGFTVEPLDDDTYRRVLLCKARLLNRDDISIEVIYESIIILLNRVPKQLIVTEPADMQVAVSMLTADTRNDEALLINYMSKYFIPAGVKYTLTLT